MNGKQWEKQYYEEPNTQKSNEFQKKKNTHTHFKPKREREKKKTIKKSINRRVGVVR